MTLSRRPVFTQSNESQPTPPIPTLRRQTRTRRPRPRSVYSSPPNVAPRESSLYLPADGSNSPYNTSVTFPARHSYPPASASCFNIPQYAFFDTQAHIDIWEELFVSAHHTTKARVQRDQKERNRLTSAIVLGSTMPGEESKLLEKALKGLGMRSEIWSKVGFFVFLILSRAIIGGAASNGWDGSQLAFR